MPPTTKAEKGERVKAGFAPASPPENAVIDPVVDLDEEIPESLMSSQEFMSEEQDTTRHILAGDPVPTPFADALGLDRRFLTPEREIKASAEVADVGGDASDPLGDLIRREVNKLMAAELEKLRGASGLANLGTQPFQGGVQLNPAPPSFTHHFRCDVSRDLTIQELDMSALDVGARPQAHPIPGSYIRFRAGHLYLHQDKPGDANKIRQLEYMMERAMYSSDGEQTLGGNPSIYIDDGADIFRCTQGCDYITASKNAWKAHMRATHQVEVN